MSESILGAMKVNDFIHTQLRYMRLKTNGKFSRGWTVLSRWTIGKIFSRLIQQMIIMSLPLFSALLHTHIYTYKHTCMHQTHVHSTKSYNRIYSVNSHFKKKITKWFTKASQWLHSPYFIESPLLINSDSIDSLFVCLATYPPNIS